MPRTLTIPVAPEIGVPVDRVYSKADFMEMAGISESTFQRWAQDGLPLHSRGAPTNAFISGREYRDWIEGGPPPEKQRRQPPSPETRRKKRRR